MTSPAVSYQKQLEERHRRNLKAAAERLRGLAADVERASVCETPLMISVGNRIVAVGLDVERAVASLTSSAEMLAVGEAAIPKPDASTGCPHSTEPGDFCSACMLPQPQPPAGGLRHKRTRQ